MKMSYPCQFTKTFPEKNLNNRAEVLTEEIYAQESHSSVDVLNTSPMVQEFKLCFSSS